MFPLSAYLLGDGKSKLVARVRRRSRSLKSRFLRDHHLFYGWRKQAITLKVRSSGVVFLVRGKQVVADPLFPTCEQRCGRPAWVRFLSPTQVNHSQRRTAAMDLEEYVVTVDSTRHRVCLESV